MAQELTREYLDKAFEKLATKENLDKVKKDLDKLVTKDDIGKVASDLGKLNLTVEKLSTTVQGVELDIRGLKSTTNRLEASMATKEDIAQVGDQMHESFSGLQSSVDRYFKRTEDWHDEHAVLKARYDLLVDLLDKKGLIKATDTPRLGNQRLLECYLAELNRAQNFLAVDNRSERLQSVETVATTGHKYFGGYVYYTV